VDDTADTLVSPQSGLQAGQGLESANEGARCSRWSSSAAATGDGESTVASSGVRRRDVTQASLVRGPTLCLMAPCHTTQHDNQQHLRNLITTMPATLTVIIAPIDSDPFHGRTDICHPCGEASTRRRGGRAGRG
jgi:hypothetical protein